MKARKDLTEGRMTTELEELIRYWKTYLIQHPVPYESELQDKIKETIPYLEELKQLKSTIEIRLATNKFCH